MSSARLVRFGFACRTVLWRLTHSYKVESVVVAAVDGAAAVVALVTSTLEE